MLNPAILRRRRWGGNPLAAYAAGGIKPATVLDFENDIYAGTVSSFADLSFAATSNATVIDSDGVLKWRAHNLLTYSEDFSQGTWQQNNVTEVTNAASPRGTPTAWELTSTTSASYARGYYGVAGGNVPGNKTFKAGVWLKGSENFTGSIRLRQNSTQVLVEDVSVTTEWQLFTVEATATATTGGVDIHIFLNGSGLAGVSSVGRQLSIWGAHIYNSSLGGMQNNPLTGDSYVPTTDAAVYMPRFDYETGARRLLIEPTAATNLLLNSGTLSTQNVTTTAQAYTLHFTGTGTVTLSGTSTAGPLVGTGTGGSNRVSLTFTPTAGTLTLTVTGTVTNAQLETGSVPTSYIPTSGATATRAAETSTFDMDAGTYDVRVVTEDGTTDLTSVVHGGGAYWPTEANGRVAQVIVYPEGALA